jgi:hypothetical protein
MSQSSPDPRSTSSSSSSRSRSPFGSSSGIWSKFPSRRECLVVAATSAALALGAAACGLYGVEPPATSGGGRDGVEQVLLKIAVVPSDVQCVRLTAEGAGRSVVRELPVSGGVELKESLSGLPIGTVTFLGEAFTGACTSVSKSTIAAWASAPVETSIVLGRLTTVELVMVRNGRANVGVTFTEEGACTQTGAACRIASECCSKKCTAGLCATPDGGAAD